MSDWDASDDETKAAPAPAAAPKVVLPKKSRFAGEDEAEKNQDSDDWDASSASESEKPVAVAVAPTKKKGTLKAKLAEKEAMSRNKSQHALSDDDPMLEMTPQERRRLERQQELEADLANASDLLGAAAIADPALGSLATMPFNKDTIGSFSATLVAQVLAQHQSNPLYSKFLDEFLRALVEPLKDSDVRKLSSMLSTVANAKQAEQRAAKGGKGAKKAAAKPALGGSKGVSATDTRAYEDALDDGDDDFM